MKRLLIIMALLMLMTACAGGEDAAPAATAVSAPAAAEESGEAAADESEMEPAAEQEALPTAAAPDDRAAGETGEAAAAEAEGEAPALENEGGAETGQPAPEDEAQSVQPIEVTYFTPAQQEGPYYTVEKPADRDNDLLDFAGAEGEPQGQPLSFAGVVYDANGWPVPGVTVEIWQTDNSGVYLHPGDPGTASRDPNFQFYGESVTGEDGVYSFRTIVPGHYEPRPRHIHVKVKRDGQELLTTQFYFADELALQGNEAAMLIDPVPAEDDQGKPILVGERDIILSMPLVER